MASGTPQSTSISTTTELARVGIPVQPRTQRLRVGLLLPAALAILYALVILVVASLRPELGIFTYDDGRIFGVESGSSAERAGLTPGDRLLAIGNERIDDAVSYAAAAKSLTAGRDVEVWVSRDGVARSVTLVPARQFPAGSAAGVVLGILLLTIAVLADRGSPRSVPRMFFRAALVYVVFLAGAFSLPAVLGLSVLAVPWFFSMVLAAPITCHFMLRFPHGRMGLCGYELTLLYGPPLALGILIAGNHLAALLPLGLAPLGSPPRWGAVAAIALSAGYLAFGAIARARRLHRRRDQIDPVAVRWVQLGGLCTVVPMFAALASAIHDVDAFLAGGFRPFVAIAMVGGSVFVVLAMTRVPFGELDRLLRRSGGHFLGTAMAAALYLALIGLLGGAASALSGGELQAALAATLAAAVVFGPVRARMQRVVDERFGRDRSRARSLLRQAAESAVATLDIDELHENVVQSVRSALAADGAAIYLSDAAADGGWRCVATAGTVPLSRELAAGSALARRLDGILASGLPRVLARIVDAVPLIAGKGPPAVLIVVPHDGVALGDEDRELLATMAAGLVVAIRNARAHRALEELTEKLQREVEIAERRRREIVRLKERLEEENRALIGKLASRTARGPVIGKGLRATFDLVQKISRSEASVLVRGETGVGKELVARAIHAASARRDGPFIVVDCGAIAAGVAESALFGHEKGAFTGAVRAAQGAFRAADGGTIFLDEMGELPLELQPKLLRVLQEREVVPVGAERPVPVDVRVLAGTNRDLAAEVEAGTFREDLLYRLRVVEIEIPPLRQRRSDIPALADHFIALHAERAGRRAKPLTPEALEALHEHDWPGNVRELEHTLEAAALYAEGAEIQATDLPIFEDVFRKRGQRAIADSAPRVSADGAPKTGLRETLEDLERERLLEALKQHRGNKTRTARALGMSRGALLRRLKRYDIDALEYL